MTASASPGLLLSRLRHSAIDVGPAWFGEAGVTDDSDFGVRHRVLVCCQAVMLTPSCQSLRILWRPRRERPTDTG